MNEKASRFMKLFQFLFYFSILWGVLGSSNPCPSGFVIPDDPSNPDVWYFGNNGCAVSCYHPPFYEEADWNEMYQVEKRILFIAFPASILFLGLWISNYDSSKSIIVPFAFLSVIQQLTFLGLWITPPEKRFCRDNAVLISSADGFNACNFQSFVQMYCLLGIALCWTVQSFRLFNSIFLGKREDENALRYSWRAYAVIFGLPLISIFVVGYTQSYGISQGQLTCMFEQHALYTNIPLGVFYGPICVAILFVSIFISLVIWKIVRLFNTIGWTRSGYSRYRRKNLRNMTSVGSSGRSTASKSSTAWSPGDFVLEGDEWDDKQKYMSSKRGQEESECSMYNSGERIMNEFAFLDEFDVPVNQDMEDAISIVKGTMQLSRLDALDERASSSDRGKVFQPDNVKSIEMTSNWKPNRQRSASISPQSSDSGERESDLSVNLRMGILLAAVSRLKPLIVFTVFACFMMFSFLGISYLFLKARVTARESFIEFANCAVDNYDGSNDWKLICGNSPSFVVPTVIRNWITVCLCGQPVVVFILYLPELFRMIRRRIGF